MPLLIQNAGFESLMLNNDKLMVVLAVVLIIWIGIVVFIFLTDRKVERLESSVQNLIRNNKTSD
ncbi:MAG: CcmD family protein [Bacteroidetes bacterium]|nr:CcmD family protein [Bacteroidota bacterium]